MSIEQTIEDKQKEYRRLEAPALRAMEYLKSPEYHENNKEILERIHSLVAHEDFTDFRALRFMGKIQQIIEEWKKPQDTIVLFESVKKSLNQILAKK